MANTKTLKNILVSQKEAYVYLTLASDATNETSYPVYDSSVIAAAYGDADPLNCTLLEVYATASAAATARVKLLWDASTPVLALDIPAGANPTKGDFRAFGGLPNQGGSGITGDITLTTTGLASGDNITIVLHVKRQ